MPRVSASKARNDRNEGKDCVGPTKKKQHEAKGDECDILSVSSGPCEECAPSVSDVNCAPDTEVSTLIVRGPDVIPCDSVEIVLCISQRCSCQLEDTFCFGSRDRSYGANRGMLQQGNSLSNSAVFVLECLDGASV